MTCRFCCYQSRVTVFVTSFSVSFSNTGRRVWKVTGPPRILLLKVDRSLRWINHSRTDNLSKTFEFSNLLWWIQRMAQSNPYFFFNDNVYYCLLLTPGFWSFSAGWHGFSSRPFRVQRRKPIYFGLFCLTMVFSDLQVWLVTDWGLSQSRHVHVTPQLGFGLCRN